MNLRTAIGLAAAGATLTTTSGLTYGQTSFALEEILVTAQKRDQTLKEIPGSVVVIGEETLDRTVTYTFADLGSQAPGIEIKGDSDGFGKSVRVRGVGTNAFSAQISPSVGFFIDDIPLINLESAFNNLIDIERVEVLKGPQSTLLSHS